MTTLAAPAADCFADPDAPATMPAAPAGPRLAEDRRRTGRKPTECAAWIASPTPGKGEEPLDVTAVNLSRHGVLFTADRPLPAGTYHRVKIALGEQEIAGEMRVLHCRRDADGRYDIGGEFV